MMQHLALSSILLALASACTTRSHVATTSGTDAGPAALDAGALLSFDPPAYCGDPDQEPDVMWDGWIEAFTFRSGSDRARVFIEPDGAGGWSGYFIAGDGPHIDAVPRAPDDCELFCDVPVREAYSYPNHTQEGFRFTLQDVVYTDVRLRFDIEKWEIFDAWCRAQTPIPGSSICIQYERAHEDGAANNCSLEQADGSVMPIPCCKFTLCNFVCQCTDAGCTANGGRVTFDLFIEGDVASGTTPFGTGHLQRVTSP